MMGALTELERLILATLEEAGEENLSALTNTVISGRGRSAEIVAMRVALQELRRMGVIAIARSQSQSTLEWIALADQESLAALQDIESCLAWSDSKNLWIIAPDRPRMEIVLTDAGQQVARQVLSQFGRPKPENKILIS